eukprot:16185-Heterococcus_DN1.PRE.3
MKLHQLVSSSESSESDIMATMDMLKTKYADYGKDRTSAAVFHLEELQRLLMPTTTTRTCMHALLTKIAISLAIALHPQPRKDIVTANFQSLHVLDQAGGSSSLEAASTAANPIIDDIASSAESDDVAVDTSTVKTEPVAAHNSSSSSSSSSSPAIDTSESLWNTLVNVLQVTPQQEHLLASKVAIAQAMDIDLHETLQLVSALRTLLCNKNESLDGEMAQIQRILTPTQTAKFILWVSRNSACMHMLNQLWTHTHEEPQNGITSETTFARGQEGATVTTSSAYSSNGGTTT